MVCSSDFTTAVVAAFCGLDILRPSRLLENDNYFGAPCVYLLTYVDADSADFQRIWEGYKLHISKYTPGKFTYCTDSLVIQEETTGPQYIKTAKCTYDCEGKMTTVYHIFVQIPTQGK